MGQFSTTSNMNKSTFVTCFLLVCVALVKGDTDISTKLVNTVKAPSPFYTPPVYSEYNNYHGNIYPGQFYPGQVYPAYGHQGHHVYPGHGHQVYPVKPGHVFTGYPYHTGHY